MYLSVPSASSQFVTASKPIRHLTSIYWGFFSGGARNVHTDIILALRDQDIAHHVINYYDSVNRGAEGIQYKESDANFRKLQSAGISFDSLGLNHDAKVDLTRDLKNFSDEKNPSDHLEYLVSQLAEKLLLVESDAILALKEQPVGLLVLANKYLHEVMGKQPKPIFITLHRTDPELQDPAAMQRLRSIEGRSDLKKYICGYIACAESAAQAYRQALGVERGSKRFEYVPNGIDLTMFREKTEAEISTPLLKLFADSEHPPQIDSPIVTIGARNSHEKNLGLFVRAAHFMLLADPNAHAVMCGTGMVPEKLDQTISAAAVEVCVSKKKREDVRSRLHMLGRLTGQEMSAVLNISDVVALTSPVLGEADPLVLKEGLLCGAVPVTTSCGDAARVVGIDRDEQQMLTDISHGFKIGTRGILTSQNPQEIAVAWRYAIANRMSFVENFMAYRPTLCRKNMGQGYIEKIGQFLGDQALQPVEPLRLVTAQLNPAVSDEAFLKPLL